MDCPNIINPFDMTLNQLFAFAKEDSKDSKNKEKQSQQKSEGPNEEILKNCSLNRSQDEINFTGPSKSDIIPRDSFSSSFNSAFNDPTEITSRKRQIDDVKSTPSKKKKTQC